MGFCPKHLIAWHGDAGCGCCWEEYLTAQQEHEQNVLSMRITVAQMHLALLESQLAVERIRAAMQQSEIDALRLRLALLEGRQHA